MRRATSVVVIAAVVGVAVGIPALAAAITGGIDVPHNDDWAYARVARHFAETGQIRLVRWNEMTLVGHILWGWPFLKLFGMGQASLNAAGIVAAATGLVFTYVAGRALFDRLRALTVTAVVAAAPAYSQLAATYMTDVTAFATQAVALALGLRAVDRLASPRRRLVLLAAALAVASFSFTVRQVGGSVVLAVGAVFLLYARRTSRRECAAGAALVVAALAVGGAFYLWRQGLPGSEGATHLGKPGAATRLGLLVRSYFTLSLAALPAIVLAAARHPHLRFGRRELAAAATVVLAAAASLPNVHGTPSGLLLGDYLTRFGANFQGPDAPVLFSRPVWVAVNLLAVAGGATLAAVIASETRTRVAPRASPAALVLVVYGGLQLVLILARALIAGYAYDRYLWPVAFVAATLLLLRVGPGTRGRAWAAAAAACLVVMGTGVVAAVDDQAASAARWRAGMAATKLGFRPQEVEAGFEWVGAHYRGKINSGSKPTSSPPLRWYLLSAFPDARNCIVVSHIDPKEISLHHVGEVRYTSPSGHHELWLYKNPRMCSGVDANGVQ